MRLRLPVGGGSDQLVVCSNCGRRIREAEAKKLGWRYWSDGIGELHLFCPDCAAREFSPNAPASGGQL